MMTSGTANKNNVGASSYLTIASQGVTGLIAAAGFNPDPSQFNAQLLGGGVILAVGILGGGLVFLSARLLIRVGTGLGRDEEE